MHIIEENSPSSAVTGIPNIEVVIVNAMVIVQSMKPQNGNFGQLAEIFTRLLAVGDKYKAQRVDFVGDTYPIVASKTRKEADVPRMVYKQP